MRHYCDLTIYMSVSKQGQLNNVVFNLSTEHLLVWMQTSFRRQNIHDYIQPLVVAVEQEEEPKQKCVHKVYVDPETVCTVLNQSRIMTGKIMQIQFLSLNNNK